MIRDAEERLTAAGKLLDLKYVQLGFYEGGAELRTLRYVDSGIPISMHSAAHPILCGIKLFTATVVAALVEALRISTSSTLVEILPQLAGSTPAAKDIRIVDLLAHTHGLADTWVDPANSRTQLLSLFSPGRFYSYGSTGYLLLGKIIEELSGQAYEEALYEWLLAHIAAAETKRGFVAAALGRDRQRVCPAGGAGLALTLEDLLAFTQLFAGGACRAWGLSQALTEAMLHPQASMPGWSPYIKASCFGFRDFGNGWFGHNGVNQSCLTYLRINPARKAAICLLARGKKDNLGMLPAMLLKDSLPELVSTREPPPRIDVDRVLSEGHPLFGSYSDFRYRYELFVKEGRLKLRISSCQAGSLADGLHECFLYPAENELYFLSRPWNKLTTLQLLVDSSDACHYLWSLDQTIPRLEGLAQTSPIGSSLTVDPSLESTSA